jgi:hypothetical protein
MNREKVLQEHLYIWIDLAMDLSRKLDAKDHIIADLDFTIAHLLENQINQHLEYNQTNNETLVQNTPSA